jgi:hypothetical protein
MADENGDTLLAAAEERLVDLVPPAVLALNICEPVYCLRIWYFSGANDEYRLPSLLLAPESARQQTIAEYGSTAPHYLWCADELTGDQIGAHTVETADEELADLLRRWYDLQPGDDDTEELAPLRAMVQRVAARLNTRSWSELPVTDDFVVFAADGTYEFCDDFGEMTASVPADRIELLRSRKLLGESEWYDLNE